MKVNGDAVCTAFLKSTSPFPTHQGHAFSIVKCMPSGQHSSLINNFILLMILEYKTDTIVCAIVSLQNGLFQIRI